MKWMRSAIPEFSTVIGPLLSFLEGVNSAARKRAERAVTKLCLDFLWWNDTYIKSFEACQSLLEYQVALAHVNLREASSCVHKRF